jgi:hypothetical protein
MQSVVRLFPEAFRYMERGPKYRTGTQEVMRKRGHQGR